MRRGKCWSEAGEWENLQCVRESFWKEPFQVWKELAPAQRLYSQASNAVLHTLYETMSLRELLEEIGDRRVRKTRACKWREAAVQALVEADKAWATHAKIHALCAGLHPCRQSRSPWAGVTVSLHLLSRLGRSLYRNIFLPRTNDMPRVQQEHFCALAFQNEALVTWS